MAKRGIFPVSLVEEEFGISTELRKAVEEERSAATARSYSEPPKEQQEPQRKHRSDPVDERVDEYIGFFFEADVDKSGWLDMDELSKILLRRGFKGGDKQIRVGCTVGLWSCGCPGGHIRSALGGFVAGVRRGRRERRQQDLVGGILGRHGTRTQAV